MADYITAPGGGASWTGALRRDAAAFQGQYPLTTEDRLRDLEIRTGDLEVELRTARREADATRMVVSVALGLAILSLLGRLLA
jgi:hypothetical protein